MMLKKMMVYAIGLFVCGLVISPSVSAVVTVMNFDDLTGGGSNTPLPPGYGGLTWDTEWFYWNWTQNPYNPSSNYTRIATHNYGGWIDFNGEVDFQGAYFSGLSTTTCHFQGYLNNVLVGTSSNITMSSTPTFLNAGFSSNVDRVQVNCDNFNQFAVDDLTFERASLPAPEYPLIVALIALLVPSVAVLTRRKVK